ncbi:class I SAM-dependent methyltransferase [Alkalihalobacterium alkalinitrilicum]|uniref:class I SAM-dependent methyltransferase n=1 Tax=Alkalihalobacterium alkalinitrilicum TaxID=427920 RepID=UPI000995D2BF|nr:class I SAM-dependent methyltransferase [Alkalihalobacterium alkalinitrilicum]
MRKMNGEEFDPLVPFFDAMACTNWLSDVHFQLKQATGSWVGKKVLDVGCGTGRLLLRGVDEASQVVGVDLSEGMIQAAIELYNEKSKNNKASFQVGDAYHLPFTENEFDLVLSTCVLFLLPEPDKGMKEMIRVVKDGGMIVTLNPSEHMNQLAAADYCKQNNITQFEETTLLKWSNISTLRHRYNSEELSTFLRDCGAKEINHLPVVGDLALITICKF